MNHEIDDGVRRRWIDGGRQQRRNNHRPGTSVPATRWSRFQSAHQPTRDDRSGKTRGCTSPNTLQRHAGAAADSLRSWLATNSAPCPGEAIATYVVLLLVLSQMHLPAGELHADSLQHAYIGPGAGIALVGSFMAVLVALFSAFLAVLTWPIRWIWRAIRNRRALAKAKVRRVVILGLDGLDPQLVEEFLEEGLLPNLARLKESGSYTRMGTTWPPLSPVAWSSFSTGTNPGKHNIFDFISRNKSNYGPTMSSVHIGQPRRTIRLGRYLHPRLVYPDHQFAKEQAVLECLGRSGHLQFGDSRPHHVSPGSIPRRAIVGHVCPGPAWYSGLILLLYRGGGRPNRPWKRKATWGANASLSSRNGKAVTGNLPGPTNPLRVDPVETQLPFKVLPGPGETAELHIGSEKVPLKPERIHRLGQRSLSTGTRFQRERRVPVYAQAIRPPLQHVLHADQHRSGQTGDAHLAPQGLRDLPGEVTRPVRHPGPGRGHLGRCRRE